MGKTLTLKKSGVPENGKHDVSGFYPFSKKKKKNPQRKEQESRGVNNDSCTQIDKYILILIVNAQSTAEVI